jgi:integrase
VVPQWFLDEEDGAGGAATHMDDVRITKQYVNGLRPSDRDEFHWDKSLPGFGLRVQRSGASSYVVKYRPQVGALRGRQVLPKRITLGSTAKLTPDEARTIAKKMLGQVANGADPAKERREAARKVGAAAATTLKSVCEAYLVATCGLRRDAGTGEGSAAKQRGDATFFDPERSKIRSGARRIVVFERLVYPTPLAREQIADVRRSEIVALLDRVEKERGPQAAQQLFVFLSAMFSWWSARHDDFRTPIVRGMARVKLKDRARKRVLTDDEIRDVWTVTGRAIKSRVKGIPSCFARLVRVLLLTGLRRTEAGGASWAEIEYTDRDDYEGYVLTVPAERMKGKLDHAVPLTPAVLAIIGTRPDDAKARPFIFSTTGGRRPFSNHSAKKALDREIAEFRKFQNREAMPPWVLHDLRRTARTLLSRAKVAPHISERVLAHAQRGIEGTYDRFEYLAEKHDALTKLAALVPPPIRW